MPTVTQATDGDTVLTTPLVITTDDEVAPGSKVGRYLVIGELGRGGMGRVLRAYDPKLQRELALKLLRTDVLTDETQSRLVREAQAMAQLSHPNVVAVYDVDSSEDQGVVLAMELVDGTDLRRWLRGAARPWSEVLDHFVAAGRGLASAHRAGLLHRDFKPSNVLLSDDGRARVTDFGLARLTFGSRSSDGGGRAMDDVGVSLATDVTQAGVVVGTPGYMSPEQHEGVELSPATDQYALCVALWEGLVGQRPFRGDAPELYAAKRLGPPVWPADVRVPRHIVDAVRRGMSVEPADRFATIDALLAELTRDPSRQRRNLGLAGGLVVAGLGTWAWLQYQQARTQSRCEQEAAALNETWNDDVAGALARGFAATNIDYAADTWDHAKASLDTWATRWRAVTTEGCLARGRTTAIAATEATASSQCLAEQRAHVSRLLRVLQAPTPSAVARVAGAVGALPRPDRCTDARWLALRSPAPADPALAQRVADVQIELSQIAALADAGRHDDALATCDLLRTSADALGWAPLRAAVAYQRGVVHDARVEPNDAMQSYEEAFFLATQSGYDELALRASIGLTFTVGYVLAQPEPAQRWHQLADALVVRLDVGSDLAGASLHIVTGALHARNGEWEAALQDYRAGLQTWEAQVGPVHPKLASVLSNMGAAYSARGQHEEAIAAFDRALHIRREVFGDWHPATADAWNNAGAAALEAGVLDEALQALQQAKAIRDKVLRPDHLDRGTTANNIANVLTLRGQYDEAAPMYEDALAIKRSALGPKHPEVGLALSNLASVNVRRGDPLQATIQYDEALEILAGSAVPPESVAKTQFAAAEALWDAGEHARGVQLARDARSAFDKLAHAAARTQSDAIEAWLATHRAPGQPVEIPSG